MMQRNNVNKNEKLKQLEYITFSVGEGEFLLILALILNVSSSLIDAVLRVTPTAVIALAYKNSLFHTVCNDFAAVTLCIV